MADTVPAGLVQARLDRADHARFQRHQRAARRRCADAVRAFVHVEEVAHAVAGAVAIVHARRPQWRTRECIQLRAAGALGETCARQSDHPFQHQRGVAALLGGGLAQGEHAGDVGGAAEILSARVDQQQALGLQRAVRLRRGAVVRQCAVGLVAGDGGETLPDPAGLGRAFLVKQRVHVQLGQRHAGGEPLLQPAKTAHQRRTVAPHRVADVVEFGGALDRLECGARIGRLDADDLRRDCRGDRADHPAAVQQQAVVRAQLPQRRGDRSVIGDADAVGGQCRHQRIVEFGAADEQGGAGVGAHQQMGEEYRVALDVAAAQVGQPGDVVEA